MSEAAPPTTPNGPSGITPRSVALLGLKLAALGVLLTFIVTRARATWDEWKNLGRERYAVEATNVIGYPGISPDLSFAQKPADWFREDGESTMLWGGWKHGSGHQWFRIGRGQVDRKRLSNPVGRDVFQAIDHPVVELGGGTIWGRIPDGADVTGSELAGVATVYPNLVLSKVLVVNDTVRDRPFLILANPIAWPETHVGVFEPLIEGRRVTMGLSGYFLEGQPVLYDRGTESLWVAGDDGLRAIAGTYQGRVLRRLSRPVTVSWRRWRSEHPDSRLVVGADRSHALPEL